MGRTAFFSVGGEISYLRRTVTLWGSFFWKSDVTVSMLACLVAEESGHIWSGEEQPDPALQMGTVYMSEEEPSRGPVVLDTSAEEADAVLGLDSEGNHMVMLSVIPGEAGDKLSSEPSIGTCAAGREEDSPCHLPESLFSLDSDGDTFPDREEVDYLQHYTEPEAVETDLAPTEDSNHTDSQKFPKVSCEERNVTGLENFTLKILNMSQVRKNDLLLFFLAHLFFILVLFFAHRFFDPRHYQLSGGNLDHIVSRIVFSGCISENGYN